jgi:hypothetical protein
MAIFTPRSLYSQGRSPWYPLGRRLSGPQSRSGRGGEEKNSQPPPGINPNPIVQPVAQRYTDWAVPALDDDNIPHFILIYIYIYIILIYI